jgi:hypothetical protein
MRVRFPSPAPPQVIRGHIRFSHDAFADDGEVNDESTAGFQRDYMTEFHDDVERVW